MKKILSVSLILVMLVAILATFSSCGGSEKKIAKRVEQLERKGEIEFDRDAESPEEEGEYWTDEINEELAREVGDSLDGEVEWAYWIDCETYVLCFEKEKDAKRAMDPLSYWKREHRYGEDDKEWDIVREGKVVLFGHEDVIDLILD